MHTSLPASNRIDLIDVLRALALLGILVIHSMAHFSCANYPPNPGSWLKLANFISYETTCFLFEFKAFTLFSFLFGLSFFIQLDRSEKRGTDFRGRFAWRLILLFGFGILNSCFFDGDILTIFAVTGFILIPFYQVRTRYLMLLGTLFLLYPLGIYNLIAEIIHPGNSLTSRFSLTQRNDDTFISMVQWNLTDGIVKRFILQVWAGRIFMTIGMFFFGICAGRARLFEKIDSHKNFFKNLFIISLVSAILFYLLNHFMHEFVAPRLVDSAKTLTSIYWSLSYTSAFVGLVCYLFRPPLSSLMSKLLAPVGKMSLTCYVSQSIFFTILYADWGLGLAHSMGFFYSSVAGIFFFIIQAYACSMWLRLFQYGPLEWFWRSGTLLKWQRLRK